MLKSLSTVLAMAFMSACGTPRLAFQDNRVHDLVKSFESDYKISISYMPITFVEILDKDNPNTVGRCYGPFSRHIELNSPAWDKLSNTDRKTLVYHELGHCVFGRAHRDDYLPNGCPASYMNSIVVAERCVAADPAYYINELGQ